MDSPHAFLDDLAVEKMTVIKPSPIRPGSAADPGLGGCSKG